MLPAQCTGFNTLDNCGHKKKTQSKRKRTGKKRLKGHGPEHVYNTLGYIYIVLLSLSAVIIVQELCESQGGRPGLSVLTSLLVSVDVKIYCTVLRHWSQLVPNMSTDI